MVGIKITIKDKQEASALMIMIMALAGIFLMAFGAAYLVFFSVRSADIKNNAVKARYAAESCLGELKYTLSDKYYFSIYTTDEEGTTTVATTTDLASLCPLGTSTQLFANDVLGTNMSCSVSCDTTGTTSNFIISGRSSSAVYNISKPYITDLLAAWRMNEHDWTTQSAWDASGHNNVATPAGGILTASPVVHPSFVYSGAFVNGTEYLDGGNLTFADKQNWSISFWAYINSTGEPKTVLYAVDGYATNTVSIVNNEQLRVYFDIGGSLQSYAFNHLTNPITWNDTWHNFVITYDGANLLAYVDGVAFNDNYSVSGDLTSGSDNLIIGLDSSVGVQGFYGNLDEVRFYNKALSADEAKTLHDYLLLY